MKQKTLRHSSFKIYYRPDFMLGPGAQDRDKLSRPSWSLETLRSGIQSKIQINKETIMSQDDTFNRCTDVTEHLRETSSQRSKSKKKSIPGAKILGTF